MAARNHKWFLDHFAGPTERKAAEEFLETFQVPPNLSGLRGFTIELEEVLDWLGAMCTEELEPTISGWVSIAKAARTWPEVTNELPLNKASGPDYKSLRERGAANLPDYPLYAALWFPPDNPALGGAYSSLKALVLLASLKAKRTFPTPRSTFRQLRRVGEEDYAHGSELLNVLNKELLEERGADLADELVESLRNHFGAPEREESPLQSIMTLLAVGIAGDPPPKRGGRTGHSHGGAPIVGGRYHLEDPLDRLSGWPQTKVVDEDLGLSVSRLLFADFADGSASTVVKNRDRNGSAPFEVPTHADYLLTDDPSRGSGSARFRARTLVDVLATSGYHFVFSRRAASPAQQAGLLTQLQHLALAGSAEAEYGLRFVLTTLCTGWSGDDVQSLLDPSTKPATAAVARLDWTAGLVVIPAPGPHADKVRPKNKQAISVSDLLQLPIPLPLYRLQSSIAPAPGIALGAAQVEQLLTRLARERSDDGPSLASLREAFCSSVLAHSRSDTTELSYLTRNWAMSDNQFVYTVLSKHRLRATYRSSTHRLISAVLAEEPALHALLTPPLPNLPLATRPGYVGSRLVPRTTVVQQMVKRLQKPLVQAKNRSGDIVEYHNQFAIYTYVFAMFASGLRGTSNALSAWTEFDPVSGMLLVSDKDADDYFSCRWIPVCPAFAEQLENYARHTVAMQEYLQMLAPARAHLAAINPGKIHWPRTRTAAHKVRDKYVPHLYLIDSRLRPVALRPADVLRAGWTESMGKLPINSNRHYLRSHLLARGCPREAIDSFMGHWEAGTEPLGRNALLPPLVLREILLPHLSGIADHLGLVPIRSELHHRSLSLPRVLADQGSWYA